MSNLQYNERAWGIDLISEINSYCSTLKRPIVRAGGEYSLKEKSASSLFPDVILFGDNNGALVRHGWELKFPDTEPDGQEVVDNAIIKANRFNVDSFLSWNVNKAVLFKKNGSGQFVKYKEWDAIGVTKRADVEAARAEWKKLLRIIIDDLNNFFDSGELKSSMPQEVFGEHLFVEFIEKFSSITKDSLLLKSNEDAQLDAEISSWWTLNQAEYSKNDKLKALSSVLITSWLNKFIFAHCLKKFYASAHQVDGINYSVSPVQALEIFAQITQESDFLQVFTKDIGSEFIGTDTWQALCQFNALLVDYKLDEIPQDILHAVIDAAAHGSKRKAAGQYSTPLPLAQYLIGITLKNRSDVVFDPCCGTGTIPKAAYALKRRKGASAKDALATIWASDKFRFPLQLCTLALADPEGIGEVVHVFNSDVFNLKSGQSVQFVNPNNGGSIVEEALPSFPVIVSNLPFVRFEDVKKVNPDAERNLEEAYGEYSLSNKSDLFAYIILYIKNLISENGRAGLIVSNSWLGADWGKGFRQEIEKHFLIEMVVVSGNGRWFDNADVVTTILVLKKENPTVRETTFITTSKKISEWNDADIQQAITETLVSPAAPNPIIKKFKYSQAQLNSIEEVLVGWSSLFTDVLWVNQIKDKLVKVSTLFEISRGERRGWNEMFYPADGHGIEKEYIKPVLKSSASISGYMATSEGDAFCCSDSLPDLIKHKKAGAINWIKSFENEKNTSGQRLTEVLARAGHHWYEMKDTALADLVLSMNPDKRIFIARMKVRGFVDQRLIRFTKKAEPIDVDLCHALLNSVLGLFFIESSGFGRGLGALDLSATKLSSGLCMLNPTLLSANDVVKIKELFLVLREKSVKDLLNELVDADRIKFDKKVFEAFGLSDALYEKVKSSLLQLYSIRQAVKE